MCCFRIECCQYLPGYPLASPPPLCLPRAHGESVSPGTLSHSVLLSPTPLILPFMSLGTAVLPGLDLYSVHICPSLLMRLSCLWEGLLPPSFSICYILQFLGIRYLYSREGDNLGEKNSNESDSPS